jgi:anti-sigma factor RsiW
MTTERDCRNDRPVDEADLHAFVDGQLADERRDLVMAHLSANSDARERVDSYRRQRALLLELRSQLQGIDNSAFRPDLQGALASAMRRQETWRSTMRGATGLAAGVALVMVGYAAFLNLAIDEPTPLTTAASTSIATRASVQREFTFGGGFIGPTSLTPAVDGEASLSWLADHLADAKLDLPDLKPLGLRLTGGGVLPGSSAPAVRLVYKDEEGNHLLLYMGVIESKAEQAFTLMPEGLLSLHWRQGPLVFALVGSVDSPRLLDVMRLVNEGVVQVPATVPDARVVDADEAVQKVEAPVLEEADVKKAASVDTASIKAVASDAAGTVAPLAEPSAEPAKAVAPVPAPVAPSSAAPAKGELPKPL